MKELESYRLFLSCLFSKTGAWLLSFILMLIGGLAAIIFASYAFTGTAHAASRIKDIVAIEGIRDNILMGYGLVVGLNGTGDKLNNAAFTEKSLVAFLERLGVNTRGESLKTKNVAAVTVTAKLPAFARTGGRINVTVSTLGDAKSLQGGVLLATPLLGADGEVYAVAQGTLSIEGFAAGGAGASVSKGVPTAGIIANGAIVEKEVLFDINSLKKVNLSLRNPDISTAMRIEEAINFEIGDDIGKMLDPGTVELTIPAEYHDSVSGLLAKVEQLEVSPDQVAKVVIDEASGTIVMGENVRVDRVAVAQGNLVVRVQETTTVSQTNPFAPIGSETVITKEKAVSVDEGGDRKVAAFDGGTTLRELVSGLNALGVGPRDLISILQTIKVAGALQAEVESR